MWWRITETYESLDGYPADAQKHELKISVDETKATFEVCLLLQ